VQTHDDGLGVASAQMQAWNQNGDLVIDKDDPQGCQGNAQNPCPANWVPPWTNSIFTALWDGSYDMQYDAQDPAGNEAYPLEQYPDGHVDREVNIDRTAPTFSIDKSTGASTLYEGREQYLDKTSYTLTVSADDLNPSGDGNPWDAAGIGTFTVAVDGNPLTPASGSCPRYENSCDLTLNVNPYDYTPGHHDVTITVKDALDSGTPHSAQPTAGSPASFGFYSVLGTLTSPTEGTVSGRRLTLGATLKPGPALAAVRFEYSTNGTSGWTPITTNLRYADNTPVAGGFVAAALTGGTTAPKMIWDAASALSTDQSVYVRAWFCKTTSDCSTGNPGPSQVVKVPLDRSGPGADRGKVQLGPGTLDLLTGNFTYSATDVDIDAPVADLTVGRSFGSRAPGSLPSSAPLGPGWQLNVQVPDAAAEYQKLDAANLTLSSTTNKGFVTLTLADKSQVAFHRELDKYVADPGFQGFTLTHVPASAGQLSDITEFDLTDEDGNVIAFKKPSGATDWLPVSVLTAGRASSSSFAFATVGGVTRPEAELAPVPGDIPGDTQHNCSNALNSGTVPVGCRLLDFVYHGDSTPNGCTGASTVSGRLREIDLVAATSGIAASTTRTAVACYSYDANGRLAEVWDPRVPGTPLKETYAYFDTSPDTSGRLKTITPPGLAAWSMTYTSQAPDPSTGRLASVNRSTDVYNPATGTSAPQTATTSVVYNVPLCNNLSLCGVSSGAPNQMDATNLGAIAQTDIPRDATAIFPPDQIPSGSPPSDWSRATIYYLNAEGRTVNVAEPAPSGSLGRIRTTEFDSYGNPWRELTAANRACALTAGCATWAGGTSSAKAVALDTQRTYNTTTTSTGVLPGVEMLTEVGPLHAIKLANGTSANARRKETIAYDESAPASPANARYALATTRTVAAQIAGQSDADARVTKYEYASAEQGNRGWTLRKPLAVVTDPTGINLRRVSLYDAGTGLETESRMPRSPAGGDASATQTLYYRAGTGGDAACASKPGWDGMVCKVMPAAQPTGTLPELPSSVYEYNQLAQETKRSESFPTLTATRVWNTGFDAAGRKTSDSVTSSVGTALPGARTFGYSASTGLPTTTGDGTRTITRAYDSNGRVSSYTDGENLQSTMRYDLLGRLNLKDDGKGTQTLSYETNVDPRGVLTKITDSQAGTFTAAYDADGALTTETYANGMDARTTYDATGDAVERAYVKTTNCSSSCTWLDDTQVSSVHGQWLSHGNTQLSSSQDYAYDAAGRLTLVKDTKSGQCTTRTYEYDNATGAGKNSNRTKLTTRVSTTSTCDTTSAGTVVNYAYDEADREKDSGFTYDAFGRTTALPAAQGGTATSPTYYVNDRINSLAQGTTSRSYLLDPEWRVRKRTASDTTDQTYHYADDSDSPSWTQDKPTGSTQWTRNVEGAAGDLAALVVGGTTTLQLTNLHGDVIGTATTSVTATGPSATMESDEFGVPRASAGYRYGWLGGKQRRTEIATGAIAMGERLYVPQLGRFAQVDPVAGGSCNDYDYACQDPTNQFDLDGRRLPNIGGGNPGAGYFTRRTVSPRPPVPRALGRLPNTSDLVYKIGSNALRRAYNYTVGNPHKIKRAYDIGKKVYDHLPAKYRGH
jgi:RHS repeat-associated protein